MKMEASYSDNSIYPPEVQQMVTNTTHCLNCGKKLSLIQRKEGRRNRGYCSIYCMGRKPVKMAYAEKEYGKPIKEIILEMLNDGATVTATSGRLGVNKQALYAWMNKLNIKKKVVWG